MTQPTALPCTPEERERRTRELAGRVAQLASLRTQIKALEQQEKQLTQEIKDDLLAGFYATTAQVRPLLKPREQLTYDYAAFYRAFGREITRQAITVENKTVLALIERGVITEEEARRVATIRKLSPALAIVPLTP